MTKSAKKKAERRPRPANGQGRAARVAAREERPTPVSAAGTEPSVPRRRLVPGLLMAASFVGFAISIYLTFTHVRGSIPPCHVVKGCETVQTSKYAVILGIPTALYGAVFFGLMFYLAIALLTGVRPAVVVPAYKVLAYAGALAVIPLFLLQAIVLKAYCSYCLVTEVMMLGMWAGSFLLASGREGDEAAEVVLVTEC